MSTKKTGRQGEDAASEYLMDAGYEVLDRNYRYGAYEIDIIAREPSGILVFIEVKASVGIDGYDPETSAKTSQMQRISYAAGEYMHQLEYEGEIRFDVVGVRLLDEQKPLIMHYKDVFYPMQ